LAKNIKSKYGSADSFSRSTVCLHLKQFVTQGIARMAALTIGLNAGAAVAQGTTSLMTTTPPVGMENMALAVRERGAAILDRIPQFPDDVARTLSQVDPGAGMGGLWSAILLGAVMIGVGYLASVMFRRWGREHYRYLYNPNPVHRRERIGYIFLRASTDIIGITLCGLVATIGIFLVFSNDSAGRLTAFAMLAAFLAARLVRTFLTGLLAHDSSSHRLIPVSDTQAISLYRALMPSAIVTVIAIATCWWMEALKLPPDAHIVALLGATLLVTTLFSTTAFLHRQTIASLIYRPDQDSATGRAMGRFVVSRTWHVMAIVYFFVAWSIGASRLLVGHGNALSLIDAPIAALCIGLALYAFALWVIDKIFGDPQIRQLPLEVTVTEATGTDLTEIDESDPDESDPLTPITEQLSFRDLASHVAAIGITLAGAVWLFRVWGMDFSGDAARSGWNIALILFLAYIALKAIRIGIDRKIAEEGGSGAGEPGEEGTGTAASRLATLLPLFRNFILFTIAVIAGLIVLSELGLNIAPLFAGAGVVGLAVGFGAQTLIRDIFFGCLLPAGRCLPQR
jgi:hypothetical protein